METNFILTLENNFEKAKNPENANKMSQYMKNHFDFFGIKTAERRTILAETSKIFNLEIIANPQEIALALFAKKQREFHYCAIEILIKNLKKKYKIDDIIWIESLIINNSWWDSVDTISKYILGQYLIEFPSEIEKTIEQFSNSENMWLNRSALLFQLGYKQKTNFDLLKSECEKHKNSKEFFMQKAIGWALREYAKVNPAAVKNYVVNTNLKPLSQKEALKHLSY